MLEVLISLKKLFNKLEVATPSHIKLDK